MIKNKLIQMSLASVAALAISPFGGTAMAQRDHHHRPHDNYACYEVDIENENDVELEAAIVQTGTSGSVKVKNNTTVGDVDSGSASNTQVNSVSVDEEVSIVTTTFSTRTIVPQKSSDFSGTITSEIISTVQPGYKVVSAAPKNTDTNNSLLWLVPIIGGSIALGLLRTNKKKL